MKVKLNKASDYDYEKTIEVNTIEDLRGWKKISERW